MPLYEYKCGKGHITEGIRPLRERNAPLTCKCGLPTKVKFSFFNFSFGWRLSDDSLMNPNRRGPDEYVRNV